MIMVSLFYVFFFLVLFNKDLKNVFILPVNLNEFSINGITERLVE